MTSVLKLKQKSKNNKMMYILVPVLVVLFLIILISQQSLLTIDSKYSAADYFMLFQEDFGLGTKAQNPLGDIGNILFH